MDNRCKKIKENGEQCKSKAIEGSEFCFFHSNSERHRLAASKGGKQGKRKVLEESNLTLRTVDDIIVLLESTINEVRVGLIDRAIGNTIGYLAGIFLKAFEMGDLEKRVVALEEVVGKGKRE